MVFSRQIVSLVAASVFAVHVVVGCCAHHHEGTGCTAGAAEVADHADCDHDSRCARHHDAEPAAPADQGDSQDHSCEGPCSYLAGSKIVMPELAPVTGMVSTDAAELLGQMIPSNAANSLLAERTIIPHLRSHLQKSVLLI
jgi:hypothetical protein